jgi:uncharacterized membrane protein YhaH (DUF805 family)
MPGQIDRAMEAMKSMTTSHAPDPGAMMRTQGGIALLAWVPVLIIIVIGCIRSNDGPNRYGDAPVSF